MFRLYSRACEYAIRALLCATPDDVRRNRFQARDVCERGGIPEPYTRKALQSLVQGGFLRAVMGPGGGYELTRDPKDITLLEIIRAVDGEDSFDHCILGLPECGGDCPCPLHEVWAEAKEQLLCQLRSRSLLDLMLIPGRGEAQGGQDSRAIEGALSRARPESTANETKR